MPDAICREWSRCAEALLQAHEEERVVFFCGAGISYPAKLPGFKGLVDEIYARCGAIVEGLEAKPYEYEQYDTTLELLERRLLDGRTKIRAALAAALKPNLRATGATETHAALLLLALNRSNYLRLVTTTSIKFRVGRQARQIIDQLSGRANAAHSQKPLEQSCLPPWANAHDT